MHTQLTQELGNQLQSMNSVNPIKNILICGAGGIGSYLLFHLNELFLHNQISPGVTITVADGDSVELKNISYQYYTKHDILELKVDALQEKFKCITKTISNYITSAEELEPYDMIISAVDNTQFRKLLYEYAIPANKAWLDLRSEGSSCALFAKHPVNTVEAMLKTIPIEKTNQSCQRKFEFEANTIQLGNRIIAGIGAQQVLNFLRTGTTTVNSFRGQF